MIDYHIHSNFSADSEMTLEEICKKALICGLKEIAITDHIDIEYPYDLDFEFDIEKRNKAIEKTSIAYPNLMIKKGVEIGITPNTKKDYVNLLSKHDLDFIIASVHVVDGIDPYYYNFYEGRTKKQAYICYLEAVLESVQDFDDYNVLGHIGYAARFFKGEDKAIQYKDYADILDKILKTVIDKGKGIEVNTKGIIATGEPLPAKSIIERYYQLGGKIITIGSDAHITARVGDEMDSTIAMLKQIGFKTITTYSKLKPRQIEI